MPDAEQIRQNVQSRAPFSTWLGVVCLLGLFGVIALAVIGPSPRGNDYEQSRAKKRIDALKTLRDADQKALAGYGWVDKNKGIAHIPIERAMELTVADLQKKKPSAAYPIATPETQASPAGSASASPAPSIKPSASPKPVSVEGPKSESKGQPAAAVNPPGAQPATQPGASATQASSPQSSATVPAASAAPTQHPTPPGTPSPAPGQTP